MRLCRRADHPLAGTGGSSTAASAPPFGCLVAEAELRPNEIQDLADQIGEVVKAAAGLELRVRVRVELGGAERPSPQALEKVNEILRAIRDEFQLG